MHPILVDIGPFTVYTYGFFVAAAFLVGMAVSMREAKRLGLPHKIVPDLGFYLILSAVVGARLLYVLLAPKYFLAHPLEIVQFWKGGLVFLGGALAAAGTTIWFLRRREQPIWSWADAIAPGLTLGQAVGRLGCLAAGCCFGKECTLPWAITFTDPKSLAPLHQALHPTQIYHVLAGVAVYFLLLGTKRWQPKPGMRFAIYIMGYAVLRFVIELFRGDFRGHLGPLSTTQWIAAALVILGIWLYRQRRNS
ncbi:prolipoprotein diacylglyceryl transferase [Desulfohalobium retbaense]|uniref:Phosphatidylglycerol--prolipoprotein diacylglyceryl transferase n=1 Tax=Desulfohalobium retbaense (strain ATCC 49708 / DSM 5692 / JCM 16813 / HR100) TaxID=485915 RepID=C8X281_DESRD|nr:prolipoprotein diacylglyceryl transferase [Desulfohalobium retbaense]ACV68404.1 prolipoprotein diacylglyceryl transferase [Desulfohalobium retbaense DSM 5692]